MPSTLAGGEEARAPAASLKGLDQLDPEPGLAAASRGGVEAAHDAALPRLGRPGQELGQEIAAVEEAGRLVARDQQLGGPVADVLGGGLQVHASGLDRRPFALDEQPGQLLRQPLHRGEQLALEVELHLLERDAERRAGLGVAGRVLDQLGEGGEDELAEAAGRRAAGGGDAALGHLIEQPGHIGDGPAHDGGQGGREARGQRRGGLVLARRHDEFRHPVEQGGQVGVDRRPARGDLAVERFRAQAPQLVPGKLQDGGEPAAVVGPLLSRRGRFRGLEDLERSLDPGEPGGTDEIVIDGDAGEGRDVAPPRLRPLAPLLGQQFARDAGDGAKDGIEDHT